MSCPGEMECDVVKKMKELGWSVEGLEAWPDTVGRFFRRIGDVEIDIERCFGGFCVAAYRFSPDATKMIPDIIGSKEHHDLFDAAIFHAICLQRKYESEQEDKGGTSA